MACSIAVTNVKGQEAVPGQGITTVIVTGTAAECSQICISIQQTQPINHTTPEKTVNVVNGSWSADFSVEAGDFPKDTFLCGDGNKMVIRAYCCANPACEAPDWTSPDYISCDDCPVVDDYDGVEIASDCNPDGTRNVTVSAQITPGASVPVVVQWLDDQGEGPQAGVISAPGAYTKTLTFLPGEHTARLVVIAPEGCGEYVTAPFTVQPCQPGEEPEPECDRYRITEIAVTEGNCTNQTRSYQAAASFDAPEPPTSYEWEWSDGFTEVTTASQSTHSLPASAASNASVAVLAEWANGCTDLATRPINVTPCAPPDCREYQVDLRVEVGDCQRGQREVTATASVQAPVPASQFQWLWGDGQGQVTTTPTVSRSFDPGGGTTGSVSVLASWPNDCQDSASRTFNLPSCRTTPPPPPPTINWCIIWFWINMGLMVGTGVMIFVTACLINATVWAAIAALASGGTLAAVWAALTAADIVMLIITGALIFITLVSFIAWIIICAFGQLRENACSLMSWLITVLTMLVGLSFIVGIILALIGQAGCAIGGFIDVAWFGILLSIAWWVSQALGCRLQRSGR